MGVGEAIWKWIKWVLEKQFHTLLVLFTFACLALMLLVGVHLLTTTSLFRTALDIYLNDNLFAGSVKIDEVRWSSDLRFLNLYGLELLDPNDVHVVGVEQAKARLNLVQLPLGKIVVERIDIKGIDAILDFDERGGFNLVEAFNVGAGQLDLKPDVEAKKDGFPLILQKIYASDATIILKFPDFEFLFEDVDVDHFFLNLSNGLDMEAKRLTSSTGKLKFKPEMFSLPEVGAPGSPGLLEMSFFDLDLKGWDWFDSGFTIKKGTFGASGGAHVTLENGLLDLRPVPGLAYKGTLRVKAPAGWRGVNYFLGDLDVQVPLDVEMEARGYLAPELNASSNVDATMGVEIDNLRVMGLTFTDAQVRAHLLNRRLYLTQLELNAYDGVVRLPHFAQKPFPNQINGLMSPPEQPYRAFLNLMDLDYEMPLVIEGVRLDKLLEDLPSAPSEEALREVHGAFNAKLYARGRLIDVPDAERLEPLEQFHWVRLGDVSLDRATPLGQLPVRSLRARGEFLFRGGVLVGTEPINIDLDGDYIDIKNLELAVNDPDMPIQANVSLQVHTLGHYLRGFGVKGVDGSVDGWFALRGPLLNPEIYGGEVVMNRLIVPPKLRGDRLSLSFGLLDGELSFSGATIQGPFGSVKAQGKIQLFDGSLTAPLASPRMNVQAPVASADLAVLMRDLGQDLPLEGKILARNVQVSGTPKALTIRGEFSSGKIKAYGETLDDLSGRIEVVPDGINVEQLRVNVGKHGKVEGTVGWRYKGAIDGDFLLQNIHLDDLNAAAAAGAGGTLRHAALSLKGGLDTRALKATGPVVEGKRTSTPEDILQWFTTQPVDVNGSVALWDVRVQNNKLGNVVLNVHTLKRDTQKPPATSEPACPGERVMMLDAIWLPYVPLIGRKTLISSWTLQASNPLLGEEGMKGGHSDVRNAYPAYVNLGVCVPMSLAQEPIQARLLFEDFNARGVATGFLERTIEVQKHFVRARNAVTQSIGTALLLADSVAENKPAVVTRTDLPIPVVPMEQLLRIWNTTEFSGSLNLTLDRSDLEYEAELAVEELRVQVIGETFTNKEESPIRANIDGVLGGDDPYNSIKLDQLTLGTRNRYVTLSGIILPEQVDLALSGSLDMALANLMPQYVTDVRGVAKVDLALAGAIDEIEPGGDIIIDEPITFRVRALQQDVELKSGKISVDARKIVLGKSLRDAGEPIVVDMFDGQALVSGIIEHQNFELGRIALEMDSQNMTYRLPGTMNMTFNTELYMEIGDLSDFATWAVDGVVELTGGKFYQDIEVLQDQAVSRIGGAIGAGRASRFQKSVFDQIPKLKEITIGINKPNRQTNVTIRGDDGFFIDSEIQGVVVDMELSTDLKVQGLVGKLNVDGTVEALPDGKIIFQNEEFNIREANISWEGPLENPNLLFVGEVSISSACAAASSDTDSESSSEFSDVGGNVQNYDITMRLNGPMAEIQKLDVEFSSDPFADRRDITMLILTGCTADQITGEAAGRPALALALAPVLNQVEKQLKTYIPVDQIRLGSDSSTTTLSLGEQVTSRLRLGLDAEFGDASQQVGYLQYLILDNFFLEISERNDVNGSFIGQGKLKLRVPLE